ncbi:MAG: hydroxyacid dehydrogenase [DPANN group archaeon]|nr:hydroxyacid dehydrogenase [DPANN group archaeon]
MKIALFELEPWQQDIAKDALQDHELSFREEPLTEKNAGEFSEMEAVAVFIYSRIGQDVLAKMPKLRCVATMSTGFDHIDLDACRKAGIIVTNVPTYGENTVAEHTFALILALSRKIYPSIKRTHEEHIFATDKTLRGFDLKGRTLGLIGCGNIGKHVARIGIGMEMDVIVFDPHPDQALAERIGFRYVERDALLAEADIISLHVPYNKHTHHLIGKEEIDRMKDSAIIINTARGGLIDTDALVEGLASFKLGGVGLDVLEGETDIKEELSVLKEEHQDQMRTILEDHMLMKMDRVIVTPHNAFNSKEALERILSTTLANIKAFIEGKEENRIN